MTSCQGLLVGLIVLRNCKNEDEVEPVVKLPDRETHEGIVVP